MGIWYGLIIHTYIYMYVDSAAMHLQYHYAHLMHINSAICGLGWYII